MRIDDYVTRLQVTTYDRLGLPPPDEVSGKLYRLYESLLADASQRGGSVPSLEELIRSLEPKELAARLRSIDTSDVPGLESPGDWSILKSLTERIEAGVRKRGFALNTRPLIRTLPHGHANAVTLRLRGSDEHAILVHRGLFGFIFALWLRLAEAIPHLEEVDGQIKGNVSPNELEAHLRRNPSIVSTFTGLLVAYLIVGDPRKSTLNLPSGIRFRFAEEYTHASEAFVMGHEYSHILLGHLANRADERIRLKGVDIERARRAWSQEYAADREGLTLLLHALSESQADSSCVHAAVQVLLHSFAIIDRAGALLRLGHECEYSKAASHPPPAERRARLRAFMARQIPKSWHQGFFRRADVLVAVLDRLWKDASCELRTLHDAGLRPRFPLDHILE